MLRYHFFPSAGSDFTGRNVFNKMIKVNENYNKHDISLLEEGILTSMLNNV